MKILDFSVAPMHLFPPLFYMIGESLLNSFTIMSTGIIIAEVSSPSLGILKIFSPYLAVSATLATTIFFCVKKAVKAKTKLTLSFRS